MKFSCQLGILINTINAECCNQSFQILKTYFTHLTDQKTVLHRLSVWNGLYDTWNEPQEEVISVA